MTTLLAYIALLLPSYEVRETVYRTLTVYAQKYEGRLTADGSRFYHSKNTVADYDLYHKYKSGYGKNRNRVYVRLELNGNIQFAELTDVTDPAWNYCVDVSRVMMKELTGRTYDKVPGCKVEVIEWVN